MRILNNGPLPGLFTSRVSAPEQIYLRCKAAMNCHGYQISEGSRTDSVSWCWVRVSDKTNLVTDGRTTQLYELIVFHMLPLILSRSRSRSFPLPLPFSLAVCPYLILSFSLSLFLSLSLFFSNTFISPLPRSPFSHSLPFYLFRPSFLPCMS